MPALGLDRLRCTPGALSSWPISDPDQLEFEPALGAQIQVSDSGFSGLGTQRLVLCPPPTLSVLPSRKLFASSRARGPCCGPPHGGGPVLTSRAGPQAGTPEPLATLAPIRFFHIACSCSAVRIPRHKLPHALTLRLAPHDRKRADGVGRLESSLARLLID
jgi:hypothetical protein